MKAPTGRSGKRPARRPKRVDPAFLDAVALGYLDRFDASAAKLRRVLMRRARAALAGAEPTDAPSEQTVLAWCEELIARYRSSGLLNDDRYARNLILGLRARGGSRRAIAHKLKLAGIEEHVIQRVLVEAEQGDARTELDAAVRLVKRRRLGLHRAEERRAQYRQRDLAALARAGFSLDVARRALGPVGPRDDEF